MKDNPLIISLLIGLIVILVIAGVSLLVNINALSGVYKQELAKNISLEKNAEDLKAKNSSLTGDIGKLNLTIEDLKEENMKIEKLKEKLEENLKEELMKQKVTVE
ncbi:MAG: hypothetical protein P9M02_04890 [Candidatus Susulua stagnicola]|nr:hypothetical protein [Candidatus Susulua stagnicola]